jgi:ankyrin repeat protein
MIVALLLLMQMLMPHGRTALHEAASAGKEELIRRLLADGADPNARDESGASPLDEAVWQGSVEIAKLLLDGGAKLNEPETKTGATPLNEAVFKGHIDVVRLLLARGADASVRDHAGFLPVENALREHQLEVMLLLLAQRGKDENLLNHLLEQAIRKGQDDTVTVLLDAGASVNARFASGFTALYDAALNGDDQIVSLLVSRGAKVNERESNSLTTPLYAAAAFGRQGPVVTLLLWGADPNLAGKEGMTPLHAAEANGYGKIAERIRAAGGR